MAKQHHHRIPVRQTADGGRLGKGCEKAECGMDIIGHARGHEDNKAQCQRAERDAFYACESRQPLLFERRETQFSSQNQTFQTCRIAAIFTANEEKTRGM